MTDFLHEVTWDQLEALFVKHDVQRFYCDMHEKTLRAFGCRLQVIGTRYYLVFPSDEDYVFFRLKFC